MDMYLNEDNDFFVSGPIDDFENTVLRFKRILFCLGHLITTYVSVLINFFSLVVKKDDDIINDEPMAPFPSSTEIFGIHAFMRILCSSFFLFPVYVHNNVSSCRSHKSIS